MRRRKFIENAAITSTALLLGQSALAAPGKELKKELYEWREYEIRFGSSQATLHEYLEKALIPALKQLVFLKRSVKANLRKFMC